MHDDEDTLEDLLPMADAIDSAILMHREVHFSGKFEFMLEYYQQEGKGMCVEFDLKRITALASLEKEIGKNLAPLLLSGADAEQVAEAKQAYAELAKLANLPDKPEFKHSKLIADLILSEEKEPSKEMEAIVAEKASIVPKLLDLLRSERFHNPLFPGYGLAPSLAVQCLGAIGDKRAIVSLFESLGEGDFFDEDLALHALKLIGEPAKKFLLTIVHGEPHTYDNEKAAMALFHFKEDPEVASTCWKIFTALNLKKERILATYLILVCEGLTNPSEKKQFKTLAHDPSIPKELQQEMLLICKAWDTDSN